MRTFALGVNARGRRWFIRAARLLSLCLAVSLFSIPLFSQGNAGRILGTITDQTGGVIAGAMVTVVDVDRGVTRSLTADDSGEYNAPNLLPGNYTVRAEAKGFKTFERSGIVLEVNKDLRVDCILQPGEQSQKVTVTEALPMVETTNATLGGTLQSQIIDSLPLRPTIVRAPRYITSCRTAATTPRKCLRDPRPVSYLRNAMCCGFNGTCALPISPTGTSIFSAPSPAVSPWTSATSATTEPNCWGLWTLTNRRRSLIKTCPMESAP